MVLDFFQTFSLQNFLRANKAIEEKKHEMEATMVNLGDMVGSNIQQGLQGLPVAAGVMTNRRLEGEEEQDASASFQVTCLE